MSTWKRVTRERYWEMLEILPPAVMGGDAFMVAEPVSYGADGLATFVGFKQAGGQYFETERAMTVPEFRKLCPTVQPYACDLYGEFV